MKQVIRKSVKNKLNIDDVKPIYTLILDMNSIMKQSFVDKRVDGNGKEYGMVYQTFIAIGNIISKYDFNFCYALYDGNNSGQLRFNIMPEYKANRDKHYSTATTDYDKSMEEYMRKVIAYSKNKNKSKEVVRGESEDESFERQRDIIFQIGENLFFRQGIYDDVEGDDLIAYVVKTKKPNEKVVIATRDRDLTQLISDDVSVYLLDLKRFVSPKNHKEIIGYTHENVLLKKILIGDVSDNIKGIKGLGEKSFFGLFPDAIERKMTLDEVVNKAQEINADRAKKKLKPLSKCTNIVESITDGCQGKHIYEINQRIIDLSEPLLTEEAKEEMDNIIGAKIDPEDRTIPNIYNIINENKMIDMIKEDSFSVIFAPFNKLIDNEKKFNGE